MASAQFAIKPVFSRAYLSNDLADLARIYQSAINLCVVERQVNTQLQEFIAQLLQSPNDISFVESIELATFDFFSLLPTSARLPGYSEFCKDLAQLVAIYCDLFGLERVGLRLHKLDKAMCPKFHVDSVACRLVCTYGEIGTEWLDDAYVDRRRLGIGSAGLSDYASGLILDTDAIQAMPAYAIGLLKGNAWEGNEQFGAVHRSPQLNPNTPRRLLLTLDFA